MGPPQIEGPAAAAATGGEGGGQDMGGWATPRPGAAQLGGTDIDGFLDGQVYKFCECHAADSWIMGTRSSKCPYLLSSISSPFWITRQWWLWRHAWWWRYGKNAIDANRSNGGT